MKAISMNRANGLTVDFSALAQSAAQYITGACASIQGLRYRLHKYAIHFGAVAILLVYLGYFFEARAVCVASIPFVVIFFALIDADGKDVEEAENPLRKR